MSPWKRLLPLVWFYIAWFACIFMAQQRLSLWTLILPIVSWLLLFWAQGFLSQRSLLRLLGLAIVGLAFDFFARFLGLIQFQEEGVDFLPVWLISMWLLFVAVLPITRDFFVRRWMLAAILGLIFGPLSYQSGEMFGLLSLSGTTFYISYGIFWALFFPICNRA